MANFKIFSCPLRLGYKDAFQNVVSVSALDYAGHGALKVPMIVL